MSSDSLNNTPNEISIMRAQSSPFLTDDLVRNLGLTIRGHLYSGKKLKGVKLDNYLSNYPSLT